MIYDKSKYPFFNSTPQWPTSYPFQDILCSFLKHYGVNLWETGQLIQHYRPLMQPFMYQYSPLKRRIFGFIILELTLDNYTLR
jgi:hypothetical protein